MLSEIILAQERLSDYLQPTLLEYSPGIDAWLKLENTNLTHSFKIRGALNAILSLDDAARERGIVTASSGNHAQGVAYAAHLTGTRAKILMPAHTPQRKVDGVRRYGAVALADYANYDEAESAARRMEQQDGMTFVSPYNDLRVIAGAGTIGLEILSQKPDVARVLVCVGGGGLISGIGAAVKSQKPDVEVIGVNAQSAPAMTNAFYGTHHPEVWETLAEALSGAIEDGSVTLELAQRYVDRMVMVTEEQIAAAMRWMIDHAGWLVEGGGAVGVAAVMHGVVDPHPNTVIVVSGGNVDGETVRQVLCGG